ncbi:MAG: T9SS type A sorting domain-containing protein [Candidatus Hydrothermales bacterium]
MKEILLLLFFSQYGGSLRFLYKTKVNDDTGIAYQSRPCVYYSSLDSTLYVVFEDDRDRDNLKEIYFSKSTDLGRNWTYNKLISPDKDRDDYFPWMSVSKNGVIHIVWQSVKAGKGKIYYTRSEDKGNTFTSPDTLPGVSVVYSTFSNINFGPQPKIACDPNDDNTIYVVWADDRTGLIQIRIARSLDGGNNFTDLGIVDKNLFNVNRSPYVIVDDSGFVHVAWVRGNSGNNQDPHPDIGYNLSKDKGINFLNKDIFVVDNPGYEAYRGSPSITYVKGEILIVWEDARGFPDGEPHIYFAKRKISGDSIYFTQNIRVDISSGKSNFRPVFFVDPEGKGVCAWHSNLVRDDYYSILMSAYLDTLNAFSPARLVFEFDTTFTGTTNANFGNAFYPPSLFVDTISGLTNFFLVWQDLKEDPLGNIYFIRGKVIVALSDLDIHGNTLDVKNDTLFFGEVPCDLYVKKKLLIVNTDTLFNPDPLDGPSRRVIFNLKADTILLKGPQGGLSKVFAYGELPETLVIGEKFEVTLMSFIKDESPYGFYHGTLHISGIDKDSAIVGDSVFILIKGGKAKENLDDAFVYPNPFKPSEGHSHISFTNLSANSKIIIFDVNGNKIKELIANGDGSARWDGKVASGVYTYVIKDKNGNKKVGKIAIVR